VGLLSTKNDLDRPKKEKLMWWKGTAKTRRESKGYSKDHWMCPECGRRNRKPKKGTRVRVCWRCGYTESA